MENNNKYAFKFNYFYALCGFISYIKINLFGEIFLGEIFFFLYFFLNINYIFNLDLFKKIIILGILWCLSQLVSDVVNNTILPQSLKGVLAPILFLFSMIGMTIFFLKKIVIIPSYLMGIAIFMLCSSVLIPNEYAQENLWKWGIGSSILSIFSAYYSFFINKLKQFFFPLLLIIFLIISLVFSARSLGTFPIISYLIYNNSSYISKKVKNIPLFIFSFFIFLIIINYLLGIIFSSESFLSLFSAEEAAKYQSQAQGTLGIILGGRNELLSSIQAFIDKPFLGHGSWAIDTTGKYLDLGIQSRYLLGYISRDEYVHIGDEYRNELIPYHSFIMGAFVWSGILGGFFWLYLAYNVTVFYLKNINYLQYYFHLGFTTLIWSILFSPFGAGNRYSATIFLATFYSYIININYNKRIKL